MQCSIVSCARKRPRVLVRRFGLASWPAFASPIGASGLRGGNIWRARPSLLGGNYPCLRGAAVDDWKSYRVMLYCTFCYVRFSVEVLIVDDAPGLVRRPMGQINCFQLSGPKSLQSNFALSGGPILILDERVRRTMQGFHTNFVTEYFTMV